LEHIFRVTLPRHPFAITHGNLRKSLIPLQPANLEQMRKQLASEHDNLSRRLKEVSEFVSDNPQSLALDTAAVIADKAGVHASTLVRFANHFEFSGFSELQKLYKEHLHKNYSDYGSRIRGSQQFQDDDHTVSAQQLLTEFTVANVSSMQELQERIDPALLNQAVELLDETSAIHVCGIRRAFPVSMYFVYALNHMQVKCHAISGLGMMHDEEADCIAATDTLIAITFKPYADITQSVIKKASSNGAKIILITGDTDCPTAELADIVFTVPDAEVRSFRSLTSSMCLAQTLCIALGYRRAESFD